MLQDLRQFFQKNGTVEWNRTIFWTGLCCLFSVLNQESGIKRKWTKGVISCDSEEHSVDRWSPCSCKFHLREAFLSSAERSGIWIKPPRYESEWNETERKKKKITTEINYKSNTQYLEIMKLGDINGTSPQSETNWHRLSGIVRERKKSKQNQALVKQQIQRWRVTWLGSPNTVRRYGSHN